MVVVTIVIAVLLVVALVYIVALLRSHADILRRLAALEERAAGGAPAPAPAPATAAPPVGGGEVRHARGRSAGPRCTATRSRCRSGPARR